MSRTLRVPTDSALETILAAGEPVVLAWAAELHSIADQADRNAIDFAQMPDGQDHGRVGSASKCARAFATSLRWRAQQILDEHAKRSKPAVPPAAQVKALAGPRPVA